MDFFRRLFGGKNSAPPDNALHLYVRCGRCGAPVHVRIHLFNDLAVEYDDSENVSGYTLRKELMDARCFRLMYASLSFDRNRRELERSVEGGTFITQAEFEQLERERQERHGAK
jgi:hypothetical protein